MCGCDDRSQQMGIPLILKNGSGSVQAQEGECRAAGVSLFDLAFWTEVYEMSIMEQQRTSK